MFNIYNSLSANRDLKLHLPNSQSENAIKQLKTLTSPLSKFAANIGSALDPRKYGSKVKLIFICLCSVQESPSTNFNLFYFENNILIFKLIDFFSL